MHDTLRVVASVLLAGVLISGGAGLVYLAVTPQQTGEEFTELYILDAEGGASGYPENVSVGETARVIVGVGNHEAESMRYSLVVRLDGKTVSTETLTLEPGETWKQSVQFSPESAGQRELRVLLYRGTSYEESAEPYRRAVLRFNATAE